MNKYRLKITGRNPNHFLKQLILKKIKLYSITDNAKDIKITVNEEDYKKIKSIKTSYKIEVINRFGILKIKYLLSKYKYILGLFLLSLGIIMTLSNLVFHIEVIHSKEEIRELIEKDLKDYGLTKYGFKVSYAKKEEIRQKILDKEKDKIEWLEIDSIGTKYIIHVEERLLNKEKETNEPRDIIAKKDAMILNIESDKGEIIKKKYDYVRKGESIISGTIKNKENEVSKVKASGKVYGEVWYNATVELPKEYHEEQRTGNKSKSLTLRVANKRISIPPTKKDKSYQIDDIVLFENKLLPLKLVIEEKYEIKVIDKKYTLNNCLDDAIELATINLKRKLPVESTILTKKVLKKSLKNSKIVIEVFFKVREDITDYKKISTELKIEGE